MIRRRTGEVEDERRRSRRSVEGFAVRSDFVGRCHLLFLIVAYLLKYPFFCF